MTATLPGTDVSLPADLVPLLVPIDAVHDDPANPRRAKNIDHLVALMQEFGYTDPIVVDERGKIEAGHQRRAACLRLGATHIPRVVVPHDSLTAVRFNIAHNKSQEVVAEWERDALGTLLRRLHEEDQHEGLGFGEDELEELLALDEALGSGPGVEDEPETEPPPPPADPVTEPGEVVQLGRHVLHCADCMDVMRALPDDSVDAIVTDPPYGLSPDGRARTWDDIAKLRAVGKGPTRGFMGKEWDAGVPGVTWARECLRVLKPGGHLVAFSSSRTIHRLTCAIEDAGFEIRDEIDWLYWQGFPKSLDISQAIDAAAGIERADREVSAPSTNMVLGPTRQVVNPGTPVTEGAKRWVGWGTAVKPAKEPAAVARKPLIGTVAKNMLDLGTGGLNIDGCRVAPGDPAWPGPNDGNEPRWPANIYYCPKPAPRERDRGCESLPQASAGELTGGRSKGSAGLDNPRAGAGRTSDGRGNVHPTVKPVKLMRWLLRLVSAPGATVLEPFAGSGTTLLAANDLDIRVIACERDPGYCDIIRARAAPLSTETA